MTREAWRWGSRCWLSNNGGPCLGPWWDADGGRDAEHFPSGTGDNDK